YRLPGCFLRLLAAHAANERELKRQMKRDSTWTRGLLLAFLRAGAGRLGGSKSVQPRDQLLVETKVFPSRNCLGFLACVRRRVSLPAFCAKSATQVSEST